MQTNNETTGHQLSQQLENHTISTECIYFFTEYIYFFNVFTCSNQCIILVCTHCMCYDKGSKCCHSSCAPTHIKRHHNQLKYMLKYLIYSPSNMQNSIIFIIIDTKCRLKLRKCKKTLYYVTFKNMVDKSVDNLQLNQIIMNIGK